MTVFVSNTFGAFFEVVCPVDIERLADELHCKIHKNREALLSYISSIYGESVDELENSAFVVKGDDFGYEVCDHRGIWSDIDLEGMDLEIWIAEYEN